MSSRSLQNAPFWWRRGRVELYHEHGLGVVVVPGLLRRQRQVQPYSDEFKSN